MNIIGNKKKQSRRLWKDPDTCFCRKVYCYIKVYLTKYKSFVGPHLGNDYGDVLYDQPSNERLCQKI